MYRTFSPILLAAAALVLPMGIVSAQEVELRPLGPEPHPFTTEQGRFIIEFTPLEYTIDRHNPDRDPRRVDTFNAGLLVKYGVLDNLDIQVGADLFAWERESDRAEGGRETNSGFGDMVVRAKYNLWGNDGGETAMAVMPFMNLPTATGGVGETGIRGGVIVPFSWEFAEDWTLDFVPSFAAVRNSEDDGYAFEFASTVTLTRALFDGVDVFVEFESSVTSESGEPWVGAVGVGLTFEIDANTVIEPAVHFGVTRSAEDYAFSIAIVRRF